MLRHEWNRNGADFGSDALRERKRTDTMVDSKFSHRIRNAVNAHFEEQIAITKDFVAIPSTRGAEGPCQDMMSALLRQRDYEVDDWYIDTDDLKDLPGY